VLDEITQRERSKLLTANAVDIHLFLSVTVLQGNTHMCVVFSTMLPPPLTGDYEYSCM